MAGRAAGGRGRGGPAAVLRVRALGARGSRGAAPGDARGPGTPGPTRPGRRRAATRCWRPSATTPHRRRSAAPRAKFATTRAWSSAEQAGVASADEATLLALRDGNRAYEARFGHVFLVCATGKTPPRCALLETRLGHDPADEWRVARASRGRSCVFDWRS
ncbi:MAG: 2-oxo-4-hydroxy-4-carboxy-5-ureidoimidazoline decarboxylase [bacterium]